MNNRSKGVWATLSAVCLVAGGLVVFGCSRDVPHDRPMSGGLRIVSLAPSVTEILFALGVERSLVAVTDHCDFPPAARGIERLGGYALRIWKDCWLWCPIWLLRPASSGPRLPSRYEGRVSACSTCPSATFGNSSTRSEPSGPQWCFPAG